MKFRALTSLKIATQKQTSFAILILFSLVSACGGKPKSAPGVITASLSATTDVIADGEAVSTVTIHFSDSSGAGAIGTTPTIRATDSDGSNVYGACTPSNYYGYSFCTFSSRRAEVKTVQMVSPFAATGPTVTFLPDSQFKVAITQNPSATGTAGTALTTGMVVEVQDSFSNRIPNSTKLVTLSAFTDATCTTAATGTFSATALTVAASSGIATFSNLRYTLSGSLYIKATASGLQSDCTSVPTVISAASAAQIAFTTQGPATAVAGVSYSQQPVVEVRDTYGNRVTSGTGSNASITLSDYTDAACTVATGAATGGATVAASAGVASFSAYFTTKARTVYTRASTTIGGTTYTKCTTATTVVSANSPTVTFSTLSGTTAASNGIDWSTISILLRDTYGNNVAGVTPTFSASGTGNTYGVCGSTSSAGSTTCRLYSTSSGTKNLTLTSPASFSTGTVTFIDAPDATLSSVTATASAIANGVSASIITVTLLDSGGLPVAGLTPKLTITGTNNTLTTCPATNASGVSQCSLTSTKAQSKVAQMTAPVAINSNTITFTPGTASKLSFATAPTSTNTVAGTAFATQPVVNVLDVNNNILTTGTGNDATITLSVVSTNCGTTAGSGTVLSPTQNAVNGVATFTGVSYTALGSAFLKATATVGGTPLTAVCAPINIIIGPAKKLNFFIQPSSTEVAGVALSVQPQVELTDLYDNRITTTSDATKSITLTAMTDASCTIAASGTFGATANPVSAVAGITSFAGVNYNKAETIYLRATTTNGLGGAITQACSQAITITNAPASKLGFSVLPSATALVNEVFPTTPEVQVQDSFGNRVTNSSASITLDAYLDSGCSVLIGNGSLAQATTNASSGTALFSSLSYSLDETIYLKATSGGLTSACTTTQSVAVDHWKAISSTSAPTARYLHTSVWSGSEMIIFGGKTAGGVALASGGRYQVVSDTWSATLQDGSTPSARFNHTGVWTGSKMLIWGGENGSSYLGDGFSYNPSLDSWTPISSVNAPSPRSRHLSLWTGSKLIIWGGYDGTQYLNDGAIYNPSNDTWTPILNSGAPAGRADATGFTYGTYFYLFSGTNGSDLSDGATYDFNSDTWSNISTSGLPSARIHSASQMHASQFFIWGGEDSSNELSSGSSYDASNDSWTALSGVSAPSARTRMYHTYTDSSLWIWGGYSGGALNSGAALNGSAWTSTGTASARPSARHSGTAIWTGSKIIIWGGCTGALPCGTASSNGYSYTP